MGLATPIGALISLIFIGSLSKPMVGVLIALAGGSFLYIGASDLIPETHQKRGIQNAGFLLVGILFLYVLSKTING